MIYQPETTCVDIDRANEVEPILHRIYQHIIAQPIDNEVSLLSGQMGLALFESYYNQQFGIVDDTQIWNRVAQSLSTIEEGHLIHSFASGISGVGWGFLHLWNNGLLQDKELDAHSIVEALDEPLFELSIEMLKNGDYDYLHGGLSTCLYFLERHPSAIINRYITELVTQLERTAVKMPDGQLTWLDQSDKAAASGKPAYYNLGLSHGVASITAILCLLHEKGYAQKQCAHLINGSIRWVWNARNRTKTALFPHMVAADNPAEEESRLAWCYGDLGMANTFWLAGKILHQPSWQEIAYSTIRKASKRRRQNETMVYDSAICHGSAGVFYIFNKFAHYQPASELSETTAYWLNDTLQRALPKTDENVFLQFSSLQNEYYPNLSLLDGEASIGMALLAELGASTAWDRLLLLS